MPPNQITFYQRIEIGVDDGPTVIGVAACIDDVEIVQRRALNRNHRLGDSAGWEKVTRRVQHHFGFTVAENFECGAVGCVIVVRGLVEILAEDGVGADGEALADGHFRLIFLVECAARNADEDQDHAEVDDVAAVAASVAHGQIADGGKDVCAVARSDYARAAIELRENRKCDEHAENQADQRIEIAEAEGKCNRARHNACTEAATQSCA